MELGECTHDIQEQVAHGIVIVGEDQSLFDELDPDATLGKPKDYSTEVIKVTCQPIHRVDHQRVTLAKEVSYRP